MIGTVSMTAALDRKEPDDEIWLYGHCSQAQNNRSSRTGNVLDAQKGCGDLPSTTRRRRTRTNFRRASRHLVESVSFSKIQRVIERDSINHFQFPMGLLYHRPDSGLWLELNSETTCHGKPKNVTAF